MNIGMLLRNPFQLLVTHIHERLAGAGFPEVRSAHGNVFQFIGKNGARLTELAEKAQMTKQSMSYLVEYLEEEGHVERTEDPSDRRAIIFRLTKKGWKTTGVAEEAIAEFEERCKKKIGARKYKRLIQLLANLNTSLASNESK